MAQLPDKSLIYVTQPHLPPVEDFIIHVRQIWENRQLTNGGPFHEQLESALCEYLGVEYLSLFANGTLALVTALQALRISGEVITTPYSFVATAHSLLWNRSTPVFVDIDPVTLNLDPAKIEEAITPQTTAIMPVHVYGQPCDVEGIQKIADKHGLKVIYDAAHAFAVQCHCGSLLNHGDLSVLSFHATKVFNTFEGGAIISPNIETKERVDNLKNFGFVNDTTVMAAGINGKMSEICAAMGLLQLKSINEAIERRGEIDAQYRQLLQAIPGIRCLARPSHYKANFGYFPIFIDQDYPESRDQVFHRLKASGVVARRYFYPLITDFPMYRGFPSANSENLPNARSVANKVLCLPIYPKLTEAEVFGVVSLLKG